jgi:hypothetical protein
MKKNKTGGRQKGTPNKTTSELKELFRTFLTENHNQFVEDFKNLEPNYRVKYYLDVSKHIIPAAKEIEIIDDMKPEINIPLIHWVQTAESFSEDVV